MRAVSKMKKMRMVMMVMPTTTGRKKENKKLLLFVGCLTSQQHAIVSQGRICSDYCTCCHTEIEAADQTFHLTQSQYADTGQGSHWSASF